MGHAIPVAGWAARDVVRHLTGWFPGFLASSAGIDLPRGPSVQENPVAAWQYGAWVEVPGDADNQTRLLGFIGRDPFWPAAT
jgi:hypothetical protein